MKPTKTVTINGRKYDSSTGLPVIAKSSKIISPKKSNTPKISSVQASFNKSKAVISQTAKKPVIALRSAAKFSGRTMDIARSKSISHFAPRTINPTPASKLVKSTDINPIKHPMALKAEKRLATKNSVQKAVQSKTSKTIKDESIVSALKQADNTKVKCPGFFKRHTKIFNTFTISAFFVVFVGYFIYTSMPGISVRIASAQAGINATYPDYKPDGYSLDGPVTYSDRQVTIKFRSNTGNSDFVIKQTKSSWDSAAVKDQVNKDSNGEFITTEENGLTIFTYDGNATWVNGGILYNINGNTHLSGEQIRHIATSL